MIAKVISFNRKSSYDYTLSNHTEVGIVLLGTEVKSLRTQSASIKESYIAESQGELFLFNVNIALYKHGGNIKTQHEPERPRKILLHKREINKFMGAVKRKGMTIVPLQMYFNEKGLVKLEIALAKGKSTFDKREVIKQRDWQRRKNQILKNVRKSRISGT